MEIALIIDAGMPKRVKICIDGNTWKSVSLTIVRVNDIKAIVNDESFFNKLHELERQGAIRYALFCLSSQALHSKKLEKMLRRHFLESDVIDEVIDYCCTHNLLDDEEWMKTAVMKWQRLGKSAIDVRTRLKRMGIETSHIACDDTVALDQIVTRKYPQLLDGGTSFKERTKAISALQRRGYSYTIIAEYLQNKKINCMMGKE